MTATERSEGGAVEILLIEANHGDVRLMKELFVEAGVTNEIHAVYDGDEALEFLQQNGEYADAPLPDIALLDLKLPGGKSEAVLSTLRDRPELTSIPVIGMTSSAAEADIAQSSGIDADAYVQKPLDPDEFVDAVREMGTFGLTIVRTADSEQK